MEQLFGVLLLICRGTPKHGEWVVACLEGAWPRLLGERLAAVCRPARFEGSELVIEVLDNSWNPTVEGIKPALQEKLRTATASEVKTIKVVGCRQPVGGGQ